MGDMWSNFAHNLGFGKQQASKDAEADLEKAKAAYEQLSPPELTPEHAEFAKAYAQDPSAMNSISTNPSYTESQIAQMNALRNLAANGGHNAASDAELARIQQNENTNARGQRDAILQNAEARGMGGSGASLLAQLSASQNATNNQSAQDLAVRAQDSNTALNAGMGAANIGSNLQNTDFNQQASKAAASDAINRFNAGQNTGVSEYNTGTKNQAQQFNTGLEQQGYQNKFQKQAGIAGAHNASANANSQLAGTQAQQAGNILGSIIGGAAAIGSSAAGKPKTAWTGGRVPGNPVVEGDSTLNDFVPVTTSPGEVVVPRSLAKGGSPHDIAHFVKHPPQIKAAGQNKEAMLAALAHLRKRGNHV